MEMTFTTTACNRPSVLKRTYESYCNKLKGIDFNKSTLYINIDPAPNSNNIGLVKEIAESYFGNVICNFSNTANFANAVIWCFSKVDTKYFFNLEDDWILLKDVNIKDVLNKFNENTLQCILNKNKKVTLKREFGEPAFVPSVFSTEIMKKYLNLLDTSRNPEAQFKYIYRKNTNGLKKYNSLYLNKNIEYSRDIGRVWLQKNGLKRDYAKTSKTNNNNKWSPWVSWK
jgi:hypothetical protein